MISISHFADKWRRIHIDGRRMPIDVRIDSGRVRVTGLPHDLTADEEKVVRMEAESMRAKR